jgi:hypothetical protein
LLLLNLEHDHLFLPDIWPIILNQFSVASVQDKGKTTSYVVPLVQQIMSRSEEEYPEISEAPLAIVLCPSWSVVDDVAKKFQIASQGK